jgi:hypothetical protein
MKARTGFIFLRIGPTISFREYGNFAVPQRRRELPNQLNNYQLVHNDSAL